MDSSSDLRSELQKDAAEFASYFRSRADQRAAVLNATIVAQSWGGTYRDSDADKLADFARLVWKIATTLSGPTKDEDVAGGESLRDAPQETGAGR